jgi:hypothetical protein
MFEVFGDFSWAIISETHVFHELKRIQRVSLFLVASLGGYAERRWPVRRMGGYYGLRSEGWWVHGAGSFRTVGGGFWVYLLVFVQWRLEIRNWPHAWAILDRRLSDQAATPAHNSYTASAGQQQHPKAKMRLPMRGGGWRGLYRQAI